MMTCNFLVLVIVDNEDRLVGGRIDKLADFKVFLDFTFCSWSTQLVPKKNQGSFVKRGRGLQQEGDLQILDF